jgi:hypothetical protein
VDKIAGGTANTQRGEGREGHMLSYGQCHWIAY